MTSSAAGGRPPAGRDGKAFLRNGDVSPREREELCVIPSRAHLRTATTSLDRFQRPHCPGDPSTTMLPSSVVTVLAPHRSGRLRRVKRLEENGSLDARDGTSGATDLNTRAHFKETVDRSLSVGPRGQLRTPFSGSRQNTVGCRTNVDYETRRKMTQTASLDVISARMDTRAATSPLSPLSLDPPGQRAAPLTGLPGGPPLSLKPTSSSLLLSLRRSNCNGRSANAAPTLSEKTLVPQRTQDRHGQATKAPESGDRAPYRTDGDGPVRSPSSSNPNETTPFKTRLVSSKGSPFPPQAQAQISTDSSPRRVPYDHFPLPQPVPRRTALTSTSWWKQVSQDSGCPPTTGDAFRVKSDFSSPSLTDISWFDNQIHSNRNINDTSPVLEGCVKTQGGTRNLTQTKTEASANHKSELPLRQKYESSLDLKEPLKSHSLLGVSHGSKISRVAAARVAESQPSVLNPTSVPGRFTQYCQAKPSHHTVPTSNREASSGLPLTSDSSSAPSHNSQTPKLTKAFNSSTLGFERSYTSIPFHPKPLFTLIPAGGSKPNCSPVTTASTTSPPAPDDHSGLAATRSPSPLPPSALPSTPISSLLTPPATPIISSPNYSGSLSPDEGRTLSSSLEKDSKNKSPGAEGKKARRVTWEDSVDLQQAQKARAERPEQVPPNAPPPRPSVSIKAPSIFNLLRASNPTADASPICSRTPKISSILVGKAGRYRSLSSDAADLASRRKETFGLTPSDCMVSNPGRHTLTTSRHERTLSLESGTAQSASSGSLSLPPELSYRHRYSSPPYTALMSTRKEAKVIMPGSLLHHQPLQPSYGRLSTHTDPPGLSALPATKPLQSPIGPPQPPRSPFQTKANTVDRWGASPEDPDNNDRNKYQVHQNGQVIAVNNRVQVSPQCHGSSAFITETLVYSIKPKADAAPKVTQKPGGRPANPPASQETQLSPGAALGQSTRAAELSDQNGNSLKEPQNPEDDKRGSREGILGKSSRFFSMETSNEQIQKRGRFALKRSTSTPNSNLSGSDSDRSSKTNNKMDQMVNRLKKTFSTRRSEDDLSFPWKWRRTSQTPSVSGSSEVDGVGTSDCPKAAELPSKGQEPATSHGWTQNRCSLTPPSENTKAGGEFCVWSGTPSPSGDTREGTCVEQMCVNQSHGPPTRQFDQFLCSSDAGPGRGPMSPADFPAQAGKSTPSPRSPFSPFSSLSPVSSIPSSDVTDDVFYSPKLPRRREPASPCEPGEGFSLAGLRRRASTGPPSVSPSLDRDYSSCADLKYGIEPGRSYSVSSVLSSRPSRPGRISTGSRVMSVGNLCESALTYAGRSQDPDLACDGPDWAACRVGEGFRLYRTNDPSKIRSRSLPRSLTKCLSNWNSGRPAPPRGDRLMVQPAHLVGPNVSVSHFTWDAGGPPTPPPTPPLSPVSRLMSKPPSPSSPIFPMSPVSQQQLDGPSRGHLPSRGHISRLGTYEEFSDSSETTTDDEYYLESEEEKETEL